MRLRDRVRSGSIVAPMRRAVFAILLLACTPPKTSGPTNALVKPSWLVGEQGVMLSVGANGEVQTRASLTPTPLYGLSAVDAYTAWAVGAEGHIYYTTDGGADWMAQSAGTTQTLNAVSFSNALHGVAVGNGGTFFETEDAGSHWQMADAPSDTRPLHAVKLSAWSGAGIAVGDDGRIDVSRDGGRSWTALSGAKLSLFAVDMNPDDVAVAVGAEGSVLRVDAGGVTPLTWSDGSARALYAIRFLPGGAQAIAAGAQGALLRGSLDGGAQFSAAPSAEDLYAVMVFADNYSDAPPSLMLAGANGTLLYAPTLDASLSLVASKSTSAIHAIDSLAGD